MSAYDEVYLQPARANMGRMLDVAVGSMGFGLGEFYGLFLASGLARRFGAGDYALITGCSGTELAFRVAVEVQAEEPPRPRVRYRYDRSPEYWCGWALARYQWETAMTFDMINRITPIEDVRKMYDAYHEMDIRHFEDALNERRARFFRPPLRMRRMAAKLSQAQLAVISGVPVRSIQQYEQRRKDLNKAAAEQAFAGEFGHCVGRTLRCERERKIMGDSIFSRILSYTSAACDARMAGAMIPVMSNSGSGNQGIAATLPVVVYAEQTAATEQQTIRALVLSHLTVIYIKQSLGRLSALCGCVVAATGSSCGITYLMGGDYGQVAAAVKNMIANLTGMICDGAKPSCSMKLTSGVSTAVISAMMAMDGHCVTPVEGIIEEDVDKCIRNLTAIGRDGMNETDRVVLGIMTHKC